MGTDLLTASNWGTVAALASPHILYAFIWFFPGVWMKAFKKNSVAVFESIAWALKVVQFSAVAHWYLVRSPKGVDLLSVSPNHWILFFALAGVGQALNAGIFRAIGHEGVYYGFKLGHVVPWVDGFPFNVVSHPQYVGSVLSVWAGAALLWSQGPVGLGLLASYWTGLYVLTGWMEQTF